MLRIENKKLVLAGVVAAIMLSGCGKKTPTTTAAPVLLDDGGDAAAAPLETPPQNLEEAYPAADELPAADLPPAETPTDEAPATGGDAEEGDAEEAPELSAEEAAAKAAAEAAAKKAAEEAAAKAAEEAAEREAEEAAEREAAKKKKAEEEAKKKAEKLAKMTPKFKKAIGEGSLHAAMGLAVSDGILYVVDNARQGLLGKFAAVRSYDLTTGDFLSSFENIGWAGAKNMPTSVTRVKIVDGGVAAADGATTYKFDLTGGLLEQTTATFPLPTEVEVDDDLSYRLEDGKIERLDEDGDDVLSFGEDELEDPISIAVDSAGNIYVSERSTPKVVVFSAPED